MNRVLRVVVLAVRSAIGFAVLYLLGSFWHDADGDRWGLAVVGALLPFGNDLLERQQEAQRRRRARRELRRGRISGSLRLLEGHAPRTVSAWTHGTAQLTPGTIEFTPWRLSRNRAHATVRVRSVDATDPSSRRPGEGVLRIVADQAVVTLQTDDALLRWALHPVALEVALARLAVPVVTAR